VGVQNYLCHCVSAACPIGHATALAKRLPEGDSNLKVLRWSTASLNTSFHS